jgi:hypothetical protein
MSETVPASLEQSTTSVLCCVACLSTSWGRTQSQIRLGDRMVVVDPVGDADWHCLQCGGRTAQMVSTERYEQMKAEREGATR